MPPDNSSTVGVGVAVDFPNDGAANGIVRASTSTFTLPAVGIYEVSWQVSVDEPGQLILALDIGGGPVDVVDTVVGRATGTSLITNQVLVTTSSPNSVLSVRNPSGNTTALTITPDAGGNRAVSASLVIKQLQ